MTNYTDTVADTGYFLFWFSSLPCSPVCSASNKHHRELLVECSECISERPTYRCVGCYALFGDAIRARTLQLENKARKKVSCPLAENDVFKALVSAPWKILAEATSMDDATRLLQPVAPVIEAISKDGDGMRGFCLRWKKSCPCCYNETIPEPAEVTDEEFGDCRPNVTQEIVMLPDTLILDDRTGEELVKNIMVIVVTAEAVVSNATASQFKSRSSDSAEHRHYETIVPKIPAEKDGMDDADEVWQLVRSSGPLSSALSFTRIGCLDSLFSRATTPKKDAQTVACQIGRCLRRAAPYREKNSGRAPDTVDVAIQRKGLRGSSLRVNRVAGPNGHGAGFSLQELKVKICSPFIDHAISRNPVGSVITWPVASAGGMITEIIPFHVSVKMKTGLAVTCPPHCAIPRHGFSASGTKVLVEFKKQVNPRLEEFLRIFTATVYSGARILRELARTFPHLRTSEEAVRRTLCSEESRRAIHSEGALPPSSSTRSRTAGERDSYSPGQAVFVSDSNPDSDATWPAVVVKRVSGASGGNEFLVKLVGDPDESPPLKVAITRLLPDAFGDVLDRGDDEEKVRANFYDNDKLIADSGSINFLDVLTELGEYTTVFDSIFGHQDSFTHTDGALLENKVSFPQGSVDDSVKMDDYLATGSVPPGALAYPKYKICTLSVALSDVELHCLDNDVHCGSRQIHEEDEDRRSRRGAWTREDEELCFYPEGYALLDWNSRNNHAGGPHHMQLRQKRKKDNRNM